MENLVKHREKLKKIFFIYKELNAVSQTSKNSHFNSTELQLLKELLLAQIENERLISTQLAKRLGVTRSSVSQMVAKLEKDGVVYREADDVDRKIAYIRMTEAAEQLCEAELKKWTNAICKVLDDFGEEKLDQMLGLIEEFIKVSKRIRDGEE